MESISTRKSSDSTQVSKIMGEALSFKKVVLITLGFIFVGLGVLGAFLPVLPTTPFGILAALCFSRSSKRFHHWVINMPVFGSTIKDWERYRVIRPKAKIACSVLITIMLSLTITLNQLPTLAVVCLSVLCFSVIIFVSTRKAQLSRRDDNGKEFQA